MSQFYLAIERDDAVHEKESRFWLSRNIRSVKVPTMAEAIVKALADDFLYIGINATNIDYIPQLSLLREVTDVPILVATDFYTMQEQGKAIAAGADLYGQLSGRPSENFDSVMATINRIKERTKKQGISSNIEIHGSILLSHSHKKAFIGGAEVLLTRAEFDLLHYFIDNKGLVLSPNQIYHNALKKQGLESINETVKSAIKRLRKMIGGAEMIENVWGLGYKLSYPLP